MSIECLEINIFNKNKKKIYIKSERVKRKEEEFRTNVNSWMLCAFILLLLQIVVFSSFVPLRSFVRFNRSDPGSVNEYKNQIVNKG